MKKQKISYFLQLNLPFNRVIGIRAPKKQEMLLLYHRYELEREVFHETTTISCQKRRQMKFQHIVCRWVK